jgi:hypothetical protein
MMTARSRLCCLALVAGALVVFPSTAPPPAHAAAQPLTVRGAIALCAGAARSRHTVRLEGYVRLTVIRNHGPGVVAGGVFDRGSVPGNAASSPALVRRYGGLGFGIVNRSPLVRTPSGEARVMRLLQSGRRLDMRGTLWCVTGQSGDFQPSALQPATG